MPDNIPILPHPTELKIINVFGQEISTQFIDPSDVSEVQMLDLSEYQNGIYYLKLQTQGRRGIERVIKQDLR